MEKEKNDNAVSKEQLEPSINPTTGGQIIALQKQIKELENKNTELLENSKGFQAVSEQNKIYADKFMNQFTELHGKQPESIQKFVNVDDFKSDPLKGIELLKGMEKFGQDYYSELSGKEPPKKDPLNTDLGSGSNKTINNGDFSIKGLSAKFIQYNKD